MIQLKCVLGQSIMMPPAALSVFIQEGLGSLSVLILQMAFYTTPTVVLFLRPSIGGCSLRNSTSHGNFSFDSLVSCHYQTSSF